MRWIPVEMVQEVLKKRKVKAFQVYCLMNHTTSGYFRASDDVFNFIMASRSIKSKKTLKVYLSDLLDLGFFGYHNETYYVRSAKKLIKKNKWRVEFWTGFFPNWQAYLNGSFLGWLAQYQRNREVGKLKEKVARSKYAGTSDQRLPSSFPVALQVIQKILIVSKTKAQIVRELADSKGFIKMEKGDLKRLNYPIQFLKYIDCSGCFIVKGKLFRQMPNKIAPSLKYRKRQLGKKKNHIILDR
jgi:hypothetical protein